MNDPSGWRSFDHVFNQPHGPLLWDWASMEVDRTKADQMAAISHAFTAARVAEMLGEDEDLLHEARSEMVPEDGVIVIRGVGEEDFLAFTPFGIENLRDILPFYKKPVIES
jgi:hypothetical protein